MEPPRTRRKRNGGRHTRRGDRQWETASKAWRAACRSIAHGAAVACTLKATSPMSDEGARASDEPSHAMMPTLPRRAGGRAGSAARPPSVPSHANAMMHASPVLLLPSLRFGPHLSPSAHRTKPKKSRRPRLPRHSFRRDGRCTLRPPTRAARCCCCRCPHPHSESLRSRPADPRRWFPTWQWQWQRQRQWHARTLNNGRRRDEGEREDDSSCSPKQSLPTGQQETV